MAATATTPTRRVRPLALGGLALVTASIAVSIAAAAVLPATMRIRWTVGSHYQYGPETVATLPVLVAAPAVVAVGYGAALWLAPAVERAAGTDDETVSRLYAIGVLLGLATIVAGQLLVVGLNLVLP